MCAWLTRVDGDLVALSTSGPLRAEFGRQGVGWCPSSGRFGSNSTGSRYDALGRLVEGDSPRGLDRFRVFVDDGTVWVDFGSRTAGRQVGRPFDPIPAEGPECEQIPFDRDADLGLPSASDGTVPR